MVLFKSGFYGYNTFNIKHLLDLSAFITAGCCTCSKLTLDRSDKGCLMDPILKESYASQWFPEK